MPIHKSFSIGAKPHNKCAITHCPKSLLPVTFLYSASARAMARLGPNPIGHGGTNFVAFTE
jgi:hypothetical protein